MLHQRTRRPIVLIWLVLLMAGLGIATAHADPGEILQSFPAPGDGVRDLSWDGSHLWLLDETAAKLYRIDPGTGASTTEQTIDIAAAKGIAWQAGRLWLTDSTAGEVLKLNLINHQFEQRFDTPRLSENNACQPSALAAFENDLWCGTIAGWSSRVNQLDPVTGEVKRWFFSKGFPEGIATDGQSIWTVTHNAGDRVGLVYRYDYETGMFISQFDTPGRQPAGLAYDGEALWCADRETATIYRLAIN